MYGGRTSRTAWTGQGMMILQLKDDTHHFGTPCFTKEETEIQISYAGFEFSLALKLNELYCHTTLTDFCMKITDK